MQHYSADGLWEIMAEYGTVFNLRVLWESLIFTSDPSFIKVCPIVAFACKGIDVYLLVQIILATDFQNYVKGRYLFIYTLRRL